MKKLYLTRYAPNPRKAIILMAAKGLDIDDMHDIDVIDIEFAQKEQLSAEFEKINPLKQVPVLILEDGTVLNDSQAVCEYLDRVYGERSVMGNDVVHRAKVCAMRRAAELEVLYPYMMSFQHSHPAMAHRAHRVEAFAPASAKRGVDALAYFENVLKDREYLVNEQLSFADIVFYIALDFGKVLKIDPREHGEGIASFYERMNDRFGLKKMNG